MLNGFQLKVFVLLISSFVFFAYTAHSQNSWVLKKDKNGIKVYTKNHDSKNLKYYRLITQFKADYENVIRLNLDFNNYQNWVKDCEESKILKKKENEIIYYVKYSTPWPVNDRDFVSKVTIDRNDQETTIHTQPSNMEYPLVDGVVRVIEYDDVWKVTRRKDGYIELKLEGFYSPGGSIPSWIANMFIVDAPYHSILKLRKMTENSN